MRLLLVNNTNLYLSPTVCQISCTVDQINAFDRGLPVYIKFVLRNLFEYHYNSYIVGEVGIVHVGVLTTVQEYKSLRAAIMICAAHHTDTQRHTDRETVFEMLFSRATKQNSSRAVKLSWPGRLKCPRKVRGEEGG